MKLNKGLLLIGLLLSMTLQAQNASQPLKISNTFSDVHNFNMKVIYELSSPLQTGFYLYLPAGIKATPKKVSLADKEFWLKESDSVPQKQDIIHWSRQDNSILILVADGTQFSGRLQIQLQAFMPGTALDTGRIEIRKTQQTSGQEYNPGTVIGSAQLFSKKK